jgi:hypothetical protein
MPFDMSDLLPAMPGEYGPMTLPLPRFIYNIFTTKTREEEDDTNKDGFEDEKLIWYNVVKVISGTPPNLWTDTLRVDEYSKLFDMEIVKKIKIEEYQITYKNGRKDEIEMSYDVRKQYICFTEGIRNMYVNGGYVTLKLLKIYD